jgi:hypothetical protein
MIHSPIHNKDIKFAEFKIAFKFYIKWCNEKSELPLYTENEFSLMDENEFPISSISHIIYHAEMMGMTF